MPATKEPNIDSIRFTTPAEKLHFGFDEGQTVLTVHWKDGHESRFIYEDLYDLRFPGFFTAGHAITDRPLPHADDFNTFLKLHGCKFPDDEQ